ncbi:class I SAM-dependent methyltransferase [Deltaproteobacteria bacterium]|nr:class I SAM-dependent methyltransferase [Deltaproteobacteria bacterium]
MDKGSDREERWSQAQIKEDAFWQRDGVLESQMDRVISRYKPVIEQISDKIRPGSVILDVGCGPTCATQLFSSGLKIFLDPLMNSYRMTYKMTLPEGDKISGTAEKIPLKDNSADVVFCVNALDHMISPGAALNEMRRTLKQDGFFILGLFIHPGSIAIARRFIERYLPVFREDAHPYSYTRKSIRELLKEYFSIQEETLVYRKESAWLPAIHREDWMFTCTKS